ncbi:hypothetical protein [Gordonia oryzae]|uniref:hypothetical protein n=1 Tax=Gordonia oryzae TaxID=2487349 RepID=UPI00161CC322|nr:hypothetical protein [Gordonia oryzae]
MRIIVEFEIEQNLRDTLSKNTVGHLEGRACVSGIFDYVDLDHHLWRSGHVRRRTTVRGRRVPAQPAHVMPRERNSNSVRLLTPDSTSLIVSSLDQAEPDTPNLWG